MYRHELHRVALILLILPGLERDLLQKLLKTQVLSKFPLKLIGNALEFREIVQTFLVAQLANVPFIAGIPRHFIDNIRYPFFPITLPHSLNKMNKRRHVTVLKFLRLQVCGQR